MKTSTKVVRVPAGVPFLQPNGQMGKLLFSEYLAEQVFSQTCWRNPEDPEWQRSAIRLMELFLDASPGTDVEVTLSDHQKLCYAAALPDNKQLHPYVQRATFEFLLSITGASDRIHQNKNEEVCPS